MIGASHEPWAGAGRCQALLPPPGSILMLAGETESKKGCPDLLYVHLTWWHHCWAQSLLSFAICCRAQFSRDSCVWTGLGVPSLIFFPIQLQGLGMAGMG